MPLTAEQIEKKVRVFPDKLTQLEYLVNISKRSRILHPNSRELLDKEITKRAIEIVKNKEWRDAVDIARMVGAHKPTVERLSEMGFYEKIAKDVMEDDEAVQRILKGKVSTKDITSKLVIANLAAMYNKKREHTKADTAYKLLEDYDGQAQTHALAGNVEDLNQLYQEKRIKRTRYTELFLQAATNNYLKLAEQQKLLDEEKAIHYYVLAGKLKEAVDFAKEVDKQHIVIQALTKYGYTDEAIELAKQQDKRKISSQLSRHLEELLEGNTWLHYTLKQLKEQKNYAKARRVQKLIAETRN